MCTHKMQIGVFSVRGRLKMDAVVSVQSYSVSPQPETQDASIKRYV